jgi:hypothetical protein
MPLPDPDLADLERARRILEHPGLAIRIADAVGRPVEGLVQRLPDRARRALSEATRKALETSLDAALRTLTPGGAKPGGIPRSSAARGGGAEPPRARRPANWLHRGAVVASGALGGAAGLPGLVLELPFSLTVMLRSIADHARAQGEDLSAVATRLECLTVFAYGAPGPADDAADAGYFATRAALSRAVAYAAEFVAERGVAGAVGDRTAPALLQLVARIAQRLGVSVTDKAAAQLVPVLGAVGGAAVNGLFIHHFQETAWAHFTVRRLERAHGTVAIRSAWAGP